MIVLKPDQAKPKPLWRRRPHFRMPSPESPALFGGRLPGRVQRAVDSGEISDPMWYFGPLWPTLEDVLDMTDAEVEATRRALDEERRDGS